MRVMPPRPTLPRCGNCVVLLGAVSREPCIQLAPADWQTLLTHLADLSRDMCAQRLSKFAVPEVQWI